jgi:hypothetical protein
MLKSAPHAATLFLCVTAGLLPAVAQNQDAPPTQPFQAVHLIKVASPDAEKSLLAALIDVNKAIAKGGCAKCEYHLWKVFGTQAGDYNYIWISSWPGRDVYVKVHSSADYQAAINKHPELEKIMDTQVYNRYVEVSPGK